jgi:DNA-binding SARP family transcriptional activator
VETEWVSLNPSANIWLDVNVFEQAFALAREITGQSLNHEVARTLDQAVQLYRGDLLEGWYQDWCLCNRERLQNEYLMLLDKLMSWCEIQGEYESGLTYGQQVMRYERARESTHRQMMRLYYLAGDRTGALRQYERCVTALNEELGVKPARSTMLMYEQMRADEFQSSIQRLPAMHKLVSASSPVPEVMDHLRRVQALLTEIQSQVQKDLQAVNLVLNSHK